VNANTGKARIFLQKQNPSCTPLYISKSSPILDCEHWADPGFLTISPQVTLLINLVVGCCYFPLGPRLLSQPTIHIATYF